MVIWKISVQLYLSICLSALLSVSLSVCLSVSLCVFLYLSFSFLFQFHCFKEIIFLLLSHISPSYPGLHSHVYWFMPSLHVPLSHEFERHSSMSVDKEQMHIWKLEKKLCPSVSVYLPYCLSACLSFCLSVCLSVCWSLCLSAADRRRDGQKNRLTDR